MCSTLHCEGHLASLRHALARICRSKAMLRSMDRGHCVGAYIERNSKDWSSRPEVQLGLAGKISAKSRRRRPHLLSVNTTFSRSLAHRLLRWSALKYRGLSYRHGDFTVEPEVYCAGYYAPALIRHISERSADERRRSRLESEIKQCDSSI